jgi:hypothetical protein
MEFGAEKIAQFLRIKEEMPLITETSENAEGIRSLEVM